jgi:hypothetical protein
MWSFDPNNGKPSGSSVTLTNPTSVHPIFIPDLVGTYNLTLVVNNTYSDSAPSKVTITANPTQASALSDIAKLQRTLNGLV